MCFNQQMSFFFSVCGLGLTYAAWKQTKSYRTAVGVFYFFLMEFLQVFQYFWIDQCDSWINQFLTVLGFLHICFQPFFTHYIIHGLIKTPKAKAVYSFLGKICILGGLYLFMRWPLTFFDYFNLDNIDGFEMGFYDDGMKRGWNSTCGISREWLRGKTLCTYSGKNHLAWSVPLATSTYYIPTSNLHFFMMFAPFFVLKQYMWVYGSFLMVTGPFLTQLFSDDLMEQASIWCFFSICQVSMMVLGIRFFMTTKNKAKIERELEKIHGINIEKTKTK